MTALRFAVSGFVTLLRVLLVLPATGACFPLPLNLGDILLPNDDPPDDRPRRPGAEGEGEPGEGEGEEGEGEQGEGEGEGLVGLGDPCRVSLDNCASGLACIVEGTTADVGRCREVCGTASDTDLSGEVDADEVTKDSDCPFGTTCQAATAIVVHDGALGLYLLGVVCLEATERDEPCRAVGDENACAPSAGTCVSVVAPTDELPGVSACKLGCELGVDEGCPFGEACLPDGSGALVLQAAADPSASVPCSRVQCSNGTCPCNADEGYECTAAIDNGRPVEICAKPSATCGIPVSLRSSRDVTVGPELVCNTSADHRVCTGDEFSGLENPGQSICIANGDDGDGFCFGYCGQGAYDENGDGDATDDSEARAVFECPAGMRCNSALSTLLAEAEGRLFGRVVPAVPVNPAVGPNAAEAKTCEPAACPSGTVCADCGPSEASCMDMQDGTGICVSLFLACEPGAP